MIAIKPATQETRGRDKQRRRALLVIGNKTLHLTRREVAGLRAAATRFLRRKP